MDGKHQNQKPKQVNFCGLFWKNCTDLTSDKFKKILNRNGITYEICKQSYGRKQSILNDILKTIYEKEKNIGKGMQTALSCDFYYILS